MTVSQSTILSTNAKATTHRASESTTHALVGGVRLPTSLPTSRSSSSVITKTTEQVTQKVLARASTDDKVAEHRRSLLEAGKYGRNITENSK